MGLFWKKEATKIHKLMGVIFMLFGIGPICWFFTHNFVTEIPSSSFAIYISGLLTILAVGSISYLYSSNKFTPAGNWYRYSVLKRVLLIPLLIFFCFMMIWINISISLPHLLTELVGNNVTEIALVKKDRRYSRKVCNYRLELVSINVPLFHYCVTKEKYDRLPEKSFEARLVLKKSIFGYAVKDIQKN